MHIQTHGAIGGVAMKARVAFIVLSWESGRVLQLFMQECPGT